MQAILDFNNAADNPLVDGLQAALLEHVVVPAARWDACMRARVPVRWCPCVGAVSLGAASCVPTPTTPPTRCTHGCHTHTTHPHNHPHTHLPHARRRYGVEKEYEYLRPSIQRFPPGREQERLARAAGFARAVHYPIGFGMMGVLVASKAGG